MTLPPTERARRPRAGGRVSAAPPSNSSHNGAVDTAPPLTVLVAADGRDKSRLLAALAEGVAPDAVQAARTRDAAAMHASDVVHANGHETAREVAASPPDALLAARLRLAAARAEDAQLRAEPDGVLPPDTGRALRLVDAAAEYRAGLLRLAATRARVAAIEQAIAASERRLAAFGCDRDSATQALPVPASALLAWQERVTAARGAATAAADDAAAARAHAHRLGFTARDALAATVTEDAPDVDARWQRLWRLRRDLEELWDVQSRAEAEARALADHEAELAATAGHVRRMPSRSLLRFSGLAALAGSLLALHGVLWRGAPPDVRDGVAAAALIAVQGGLLLWHRVAERSARRRRQIGDRQRTVITAVQWRRDREWSRAAQLTAAIGADAAALGLPSTVTLEVIDACEHALADDLRRRGGSTALTMLLVELLAAEERAEHAEARRTAAMASDAAIDREWIAWRDASGIPPGIPAAQIGEWLEVRRELAAARQARRAVGERLARLEPETVAWEEAARSLLAAAQQPVTSDACGRALTTAVTRLGQRIRAARQRERRARDLAAELRAAEAAVAAAEAAAATAVRSGDIEATPVAPASTGGPRTPAARVLEICGPILAHATTGAYTGLRTAPNGGLLVLDREDRALPVAAMPDRAGRRCVRFLLRLGEALIASPRLLVVDDALAGLDDDEAATVARAIAALAAIRPLVYVTAAASCRRALRWLPATARVLD